MSPKNKPTSQPDADDVDQGTLEKAATGLVTKLVDLGIDGLGPLSSAQDVADKTRSENKNVEHAVADVVSNARKQAAAGGFVTGLGGFFTLPVALPANILGFYVIATRSVAAIAALRGFDLSDERVRASVLLVLTGQDASGVLSKVGVGGTGGVVTRLLSSRVPKNTLMLVQKGVGFRLVTQAGKGVLARFGRFIPLAGGIIGAGSDLWSVGSILKAARKEFGPKQLEALKASPPAGR